MLKRTFWIAITSAIWLATTWVFWIGYAGSDDIFYARYAFLFHRPPINWWEFRIPAILAIRGSFLVFGPSEIAAVFPSLLASATIMLSVAWFVGWPRNLHWQSQGAMLLVSTLPIDVAFRTVPGPPLISAGLLAIGSLCMLKGASRTQLSGSAMLALGFFTHEVSFFYIAIFCLTALAFEPRRFWHPVLMCVVLSGGLFIIECTAYQMLLGEPLARFKTAAANTAYLQMGAEPESGLSGFWYYVWPVQILLFCKGFGFNLVVLLVTGVIAWKRLDTQQRILFTTTFLVWLWLGYGTVVPWAYKPLYRGLHYYTPLSLGIAALLPYTIGHAFANRERFAKGLVVVMVAVHFMNLAAGGRWGQTVEVSRELLRYAQQHKQQRFLTDVATMSEMYVLGGFQLPDNVVCLNSPEVEWDLIVNREPPGIPKYHFPEEPVDAILVNWEQHKKRGFEGKFSDFLNMHKGSHTRIVPVRYRLIFVPILRFVDQKDFMVRSLGAEIVALAK
jgi:hypothetical protein